MTTNTQADGYTPNGNVGYYTNPDAALEQHTRVFDDFCGVDDREDGREPVNTETSILRRLDALETKDMNGELDKPRDQWDKEWHLDRETRIIFDSDGQFVHQPRETSVSTIEKCEWWDRLLGEHNALAGIRRR